MSWYASYNFITYFENLMHNSHEEYKYAPLT